MSSAKFTLIGAYQFFHNAGDDLFVNMDLPEGVNIEVLQNNILFQGGEFEVQSANPFFIQTMIGNWSKMYYDTVDRWVQALAIEYAPLENYDRQEHWTDESDGSGTSSRRGSIENDRSIAETGTLDATTTDHTETKKSAFDSSNYSPYQDENSTGTVDQDTTANTTINDDTSITDGTNTTTTNDSEHNGRVHGNIGVTTSQQMLQQELDMGYWNLYQRITDLFLREFTIPVYE